VYRHCCAQGVDFTLFAKTVGFVSFRQSSAEPPGRSRSAAKQRRFIDVLPLNDDWSEGYQAKVAQVGWAMRHWCSIIVMSCDVLQQNVPSSSWRPSLFPCADARP
jgi:hypothetical protein